MPANATKSHVSSLRPQDHIAASLVPAFVMVVSDELRHRPPEVALTEQDDWNRTVLLRFFTDLSTAI